LYLKDAAFDWVKPTLHEVLDEISKERTEDTESIFSDYSHANPPPPPPPSGWPTQLILINGKMKTPKIYCLHKLINYVFVRCGDDSDDEEGRAKSSEIAKVEKVYPDGRLQVLWAYRPAHLNIPQELEFGPYEILLSDHKDTVQVRCLMGLLKWRKTVRAVDVLHIDVETSDTRSDRERSLLTIG